MREVEVVAPQEWEYVRKDGSRVQVLAGGAAFDETGGNEGVAFILDLTDFKRAEEALRESDRRYHDVQMRLADANRIASIGELSASIAHEINQPLSGIITNAGTCLRMLSANPADIAGAGETARRTLRDSKRAADVIIRLRALFAKKKSALEPVDVNEAAREVLGLFSKDAQRERVALQMDLCDTRCIVMGDRIQLQQVILNLLRNALDAMKDVHDGSKELRIETELEAGERVLLTVRDSGIGLGSMNPERLFDAFYSTKESGMGIGLSVSRSIVENHHGRLWATRNEGPGATFSLSLPCAAES
jgi:C4-dicarboxylate-specific signal transduction histidine kinase